MKHIKKNFKLNENLNFNYYLIKLLLALLKKNSTLLNKHSNSFILFHFYLRREQTHTIFI